MPQATIEIMLMRQLASYLAVPIFIVDAAGMVVFYNEPAEAIVGRPFYETGEQTLRELSERLILATDDGAPAPQGVRPLTMALEADRPGHRGFRIRGLDGVDRRVEITAFPLDDQSGA